MKIQLALMTVAALGTSLLAQARPYDACESAVYEYAVKEQHKSYPSREWKKAQPSDPTVEFAESKTRGFEIWGISYGVNEECLEGYQVLVRRAEDGHSCAVIKDIGETFGRDCG